MISAGTDPVPASARHERLALLALVLFTLALFPLRVPSWSEHFYLLSPQHILDPAFLSHDWTLTGEYRTHLFFNYLSAGLIRVAGITTGGWIGRVLVAVVALAGLLRLGRYLGLSPWRTAAAVAIWLACGQSLFGGEWMLRTFEAKTLAYGALLWSINCFLGGRLALGGLLLGLTFSLHPAVGLSGGLAVAGAVLVQHRSVRPLVAPALLGLLGSVPGVIGVLPALTGSSAATAADWRVAVWSMAQHLDPTSFGLTRPLLAAIMFCVCLSLLSESPMRIADRFVRTMLIVLGAITLAGIVAWLSAHWASLRYFPFRVFPLLLPLIFLMLLLRGDWVRRVQSGNWVLAGAMLLALIALPDPMRAVADEWRGARLTWQPPDDTGRALAWVAGNTPDSAIILASPDRFDAQSISRRAVIVLEVVPRYDKIAEWRERLEALVGPIQNVDALDDADKRFAAMPESTIVAAARRYGAGYVVSPAEYPSLHRVAREGDVSVYAVAPAVPSSAPP
jgi:hypothetical protein